MICIEIMQSAPDYVREGLFHVLVLGISTIVVAIVTSWIFKRKDELTRVEGVLLEKKLDIYRQISDRLLAFENLHQLNEKEIAMAKHLIEESGLQMPNFYHIPSFMVDGVDKMYDQLMEFDKFVTENRMYYDDYTAWPIFVWLKKNVSLATPESTRGTSACMRLVLLTYIFSGLERSSSFRPLESTSARSPAR